MSIRVERILSSQEFRELNEAIMAKGMYNTDPKIFIPGTAWYMDWYYDPSGLREKNHQHVMFKACHRQEILDGKQPSFLSIYYWREWSHIRPPICVMAPGNHPWILDQQSSNGLGWTVNNIDPLTVHPSIDLSPGYHGFLKNGEFTPDLNRRN